MTAPLLLETVPEVRSHVAALRAKGGVVVLVPTMGDLHDGHLELVRIGRRLGEVVVSIFVNPTQFAPGEDYERYPRRLEEDRRKLRGVGASAVFAPAVETLYPPGDRTWVTVGQLTEPLCGRHREGHFRGVTTVCTKLFAIVGPDVGVFGQKDAQQCLVLHRLVQDLHLPVDLLFAPTVRESDGVAMSSRNRYLGEAERPLARRLAAALAAGRTCLASGARAIDRVEGAMMDALAGGPVRADYAEARRVPDLVRPDEVTGRIVLAVAAHVGAARLIDNLCLDVGPDAVREAPLLDDHTPEAVSARWHAPR